jgi:hypothetical protein
MRFRLERAPSQLSEEIASQLESEPEKVKKYPNIKKRV